VFSLFLNLFSAYKGYFSFFIIRSNHKTYSSVNSYYMFYMIHRKFFRYILCHRDMKIPVSIHRHNLTTSKRPGAIKVFFKFLWQIKRNFNPLFQCIQRKQLLTIICCHETVIPASYKISLRATKHNWLLKPFQCPTDEMCFPFFIFIAIRVLKQLFLYRFITGGDCLKCRNCKL